MQKIIDSVNKFPKIRVMFLGADPIPYMFSHLSDHIWNDHDSGYFNLFSVLQSEATFSDFKKLCSLTLISEEQFMSSSRLNNLPFEYFGHPSVPIAWNFYCTLCLNFQDIENPAKLATLPESWFENFNNLDLIKKRLNTVILSRRSSQNFISDFKSPDDSAIFYVNIPEEFSEEAKNIVEELLTHDVPFVLITDQLDIKFDGLDIDSIQLTKSNLFSQSKEYSKKLIIRHKTD